METGTYIDNRDSVEMLSYYQDTIAALRLENRRQQQEIEQLKSEICLIWEWRENEALVGKER